MPHPENALDDPTVLSGGPESIFRSTFVPERQPVPLTAHRECHAPLKRKKLNPHPHAALMPWCWISPDTLQPQPAALSLSGKAPASS